MTLAFPHSARLFSVNVVSTSYLILGFHRPEGFDFKAGQHVTLQLEDQTGIFQRTYSIASPPSNKTHLEFCIQVQDDTRSATLLGQLEKNIRVKMTSARGDFQIQTPPSKTLIFIAGGSGISPLRSMIYELLDTQTDPPQIHLLYGCKEVKAIPFLEELEHLSQRSRAKGPIFHPLFFAESLEAGTLTQVHAGRVTAGFKLEGHRLLAKSNHFYLCGPTSMVSSIESLLVDHGINPSQIHFERYG
jgi:ring-1,2-phenylacetyl-CoA epoxidase subunit PaaE